MGKSSFDPDREVTTAGSSDPLPDGARTDADEIERLFDEAWLTRKGQPSSFLENLYEWWEEKNFLTEAQYEKLQQMAGDF